MTMKAISREQFESALRYVLDAPKDGGVLKLIVIRPHTGEREVLESCELSLQYGAKGDRWAHKCWKSLPDGSPDPDVQIAVTNYRVLELLADTDERRALAGDNLCVDLDLSDANLHTGDRLNIGKAILEVTAVPHSGCGKFKERFGEEALAYINSPLGKSLHLRGIYARVVKDGVVCVGDSIAKVGTESG
jgi:hypothetical protein